MPKDLAVAEILLKSLLSHFWIARDANVPKEPLLYPKGYLISYGDLVQASGVPIDPRNAGGPLFDISEFCVSLDWPPIQSLVVRKHEGYPGDGYFGSRGTRMEDGDDLGVRMKKWEENVRYCANSDRFPRTAPKLS